MVNFVTLTKFLQFLQIQLDYTQHLRMQVYYDLHFLININKLSFQTGNIYYIIIILNFTLMIECIFMKLFHLYGYIYVFRYTIYGKYNIQVHIML